MSDPKLVAEWVQKADGDFQAATRMMRWRKNPQLDNDARLAIAAMKEVRKFVRDKLGLE